MAFKIQIDAYTQTFVNEGCVRDPNADDSPYAYQGRVVADLSSEFFGAGNAGETYHFTLHEMLKPSRAAQRFVEFGNIASALHIGKPGAERLLKDRLKGLSPILLTGDDLAGVPAHSRKFGRWPARCIGQPSKRHPPHCPIPHDVRCFGKKTSKAEFTQ